MEQNEGDNLDREGSNDEELEQLSEEVEEENAGLNTKWIIKVVLFVIVAVVMLIIILGIFGFLAQSEYGGH
jgi:hypothetical protein